MTMTADIAAPLGMAEQAASEAAAPAAVAGETVDAFFSCRNIESYYGESYIVQGVSFDIKEGEILALLGRNGAGKSSTLRTIARMDSPSLKSGEIHLGGKAIHPLKSYEAAQAAGVGAFELDGRMVDRPMVRAARQVLARAERREA